MGGIRIVFWIWTPLTYQIHRSNYDFSLLLHGYCFVPRYLVESVMLGWTHVMIQKKEKLTYHYYSRHQMTIHFHLNLIWFFLFHLRYIGKYCWTLISYNFWYIISFYKREDFYSENHFLLDQIPEKPYLQWIAFLIKNHPKVNLENLVVDGVMLRLFGSRK